MAKLREYRMDNSFEMLGLWAIDYENFNELGNTMNGTLYYTEYGLELQLFEELGEEFGENSKDGSDVYGFSQDGKLIWLKNCLLKKNEWSAPGFPIERYSAQEGYIFEVNFNSLNDSDFISDAFKRIFENGREILVENLSFSTNSLYEWFGGVIPKDNSEKFIFPLEKENLNIQFGVNRTRNKNIGLETEKLEGQLILSQLDGEKNTFSQIFEKARSVKKLLEVFCQKTLHYSYIGFNILTQDLKTGSKTIENYPIIRGRYYKSQIGNKDDSSLTFNKFKLRDLNVEMEDILQNWFSERDSLKFIVDGYLSDLYLPYYIEHKLLNSIRNLEVYYRNFIEEEYDDSDMRKDREKIIDYIKTNIKGNNESKFISRINYPDNISLSKKLKDLIKELPEPLFDDLEIKEEDKSPSDSISSFVNRLVQTRNYYTHGDNPENYPNRIINVDEFFFANQKLMKICTYYIYKTLDISEDIILNGIISDYEYQNI